MVSLPPLTPAQEHRFWSKVDFSGNCWEWTGSTGEKRRYGQFMIGNVRYSAHRLSYMLIYGSIPDGLIVCHHCDNPRCVKPNHLYAGTYQDNARDAVERGRRVYEKKPPKPRELRPRSLRHGNAKLTANDAAEIFYRYHHQIASAVTLAHEYGVTRWTIHQIAARRSWRHVNPEPPSLHQNIHVKS